MVNSASERQRTKPWRVAKLCNLRKQSSVSREELIDFCDMFRPKFLFYLYLKVCRHVKRLWWSRGSVLACGTQVSRVQTRPKPLDFSGRKNPQHAFFRKGSKAVDLRHVKDPWMLRGSRAFSGKIHQPFLAQVVPPFTTTVSGGDTWRCK